MAVSRTKLLDNHQAQKLDAHAVTSGYDSFRLMKNAGVAITEEITKKYSPCNVLVLCGPGNNGGDGFVAASQLREKGYNVHLALICDKKSLKGDAELAANSWDGNILSFEDLILENIDLIIDAIFGSGLSRPPEKYVTELMNKINESHIPVVSVDVPSGIRGDNGAVTGTAFYAAMTVTFTTFSPAHFISPGIEKCGQVILKDIGHPGSSINAVDSTTWLNDVSLWIDEFPFPSRGKHKYDRGHLVCVGPSTYLTGAVTLAASAALRTSAGLVTVMCDINYINLYSGSPKALMLIPYSSTGDIKNFINGTNKHTFLLGPGFDNSENSRRIVSGLLDIDTPCVLDAGAISSFSCEPDKFVEKLRSRDSHTVLTPHEGEFTVIFGEITNRLDDCREAARKSNSIIILKGPETIISHPDGKSVINPTASPYLATAGSGDVLAGMVAGLLASRMDPFNSACAAVWIQSQCAENLGIGMIADDIHNVIPKILLILKQLKSQS